MSVDQIKKNIFRLLTAFCTLLVSCSPAEWAQNLQRYRDGEKHSPRPAAQVKSQNAAQELAFEPPVPLKSLSPQTDPELSPLASLNSVDRAGHRRLQLYLSQNTAPAQAQYWQLIQRYRAQYDVIWIYTTAGTSLAPARWLGQAAWFSPELPQAFHYPGFKPRFQHDGLYWTDAP